MRVNQFTLLSKRQESPRGQYFYGSSTMTSARIYSTTLAIGLLALWPITASAQDEPAQTLFTNCAVFDGTATELTEGQNVLVTGNLIEAIGDASLSADGATAVDCDGRTLMPGLVEGHADLRCQACATPSDISDIRADIDAVDAAGRFGERRDRGRAER